MTTEGAKNVEKRHCQVAAVVATALMLGSGVGYRAVASRAVGFFVIPPFPPGTLSRLPLQIGGWVGHDVPLDERVVEVVDADDHTSRMYTRGSRGPVSLFVAMRRRDIAYGVPPDDLVPHRPRVCYPVFGWTLDGARTVELVASDGSPLPVEILRFHRGKLDVQRTAVLTYYIVDGRRGYRPSELRPRGWRPKGNVRYVAQIEIACQASVLGLSGEERVCTFAMDSAPDILRLVTDAVGRSGASEEGSTDGDAHRIAGTPGD